jgi:cell division protein FtsZ
MKITQGLGAGSRPEIGRAAAEETHRAGREDARRRAYVLHRCRHGRRHRHRCGPGHRQGGARQGHPDRGCRDQAVQLRRQSPHEVAEAGIAELQKHVDTLIVIPNQNLFLIANPNTTFKEAFQMADQVLQQGVRGITDLMVMPGLINLDFADVRSSCPKWARR